MDDQQGPWVKGIVRSPIATRPLATDLPQIFNDLVMHNKMLRIIDLTKYHDLPIAAGHTQAVWPAPEFLLTLPEHASGKPKARCED